MVITVDNARRRYGSELFYTCCWVVVHYLSSILFWALYYTGDHPFFYKLQSHDSGLAHGICSYLGCMAMLYVAYGIGLGYHRLFHFFFVERNGYREETHIRLFQLKASIVFPIASTCIGSYLKGVHAFWMFVGFIGTVISAMAYRGHLNNEYGMADAFFGVAIGIIFTCREDEKWWFWFQLTAVSFVGGLRHLMPVWRAEVRRIIDETRGDGQGQGGAAG